MEASLPNTPAGRSHASRFTEQYVVIRTPPRTKLEAVQADRVVLDGEVIDVSVLFADLRGFTAVAEQLAPRRMAGLLNRYFTAMVDVILARQGMVQDFVGDGILVVFGAPTRDPEHAWRATVTAIEMQAALEFLRRRLRVEGMAKLAMGISVHSGEVFAGTIGSPRQAKYAAVGDTVNVASRLEELNRELGTSIVMSGETIALLSNRAEARSRGWFPVRGRRHPLEVFELLGLRRPLRDWNPALPNFTWRRKSVHRSRSHFPLTGDVHECPRRERSSSHE